MNRNYHSREKLRLAAILRVNGSDDEDDEGARSYEPIDLLQDAGINAIDIVRLKKNGFATVGQLFQVSQRKLLGMKGINEAKMDKVRGYSSFVWIKRQRPN